MTTTPTDDELHEIGDGDYNGYEEAIDAAERRALFEAGREAGQVQNINFAMGHDIGFKLSTARVEWLLTDEAAVLIRTLAAAGLYDDIAGELHARIVGGADE